MAKQPHLKIEKKDISDCVLLPGDPKRVDTIGKYLNDFKIIASNREYCCGTGLYKNKKITICSTGIGCPSTAIAVEELINAGAKHLIRVGTCGGSWRNNIKAGSLIIATASIRDEGTTIEYIPKGFPAVADIEIINALIKSGEELGEACFVGINRTHDSFYGSQSAINKWGTYLNEERWKKEDTPILSSEMESSALFIIACLRNVKAGAIFAVNADPEPLKNRITGQNLQVITEKNEKLSQQVKERMIRVALEATLKLK